MEKNTLLLLGLILAVFCGYLVWTRNSAGGIAKSTAEAQTQAVAIAMTAFLNSLSADQRKKVQFPFTLQRGPRSPGSAEAAWVDLPALATIQPEGLKASAMNELQRTMLLDVILPSLMLMSKTRSYPFLRIGGAVFGGAASVGWIFERILNVEAPVDTIVNAFARHALWIAISLLLLSLALRFLPGALARRAMTTEWRSSSSEWRPLQRGHALRINTGTHSAPR